MTLKSTPSSRSSSTLVWPGPYRDTMAEPPNDSSKKDAALPLRLIARPIKDEHGAVGVVWLREPIACKCGRATCLVMNRDGVSRCLSCDMDYVEEK